MMKKGIFTATALAAMAVTAAPAAAQQDFYGSLQVGIADFVFTESNGLSAVATLGMPLRQFGDNVAFEAEYSTTLSDPELGGFEVSYDTFAGYGVYALPIGEELAIRTRLGLAYERVEIGAASDSNIAGSGSVGFTYQLQNNLRLIADHTVIGTDIANTTVGVQMSF
ncbi:outer membrane beta-barrel protein [Ectothiorhodospiraceae bacterium 2226]|nr:outer membrane beta-barrel protein [Ectothiorhodospiraceae bacterium 2226]